MTTTAMLMAAALVAGQLDGQAPARSPGEISGLVKAKTELPVPAVDGAALKQLLVSEGQYVVINQELGYQTDEELRAQRVARARELDLAIVQAASDVEEKAAVETAKTAFLEYQESVLINRREPGAIPATQVRRQELQYLRARNQAIAAREARIQATIQTHVRRAEVDAIDVAMQRRTIRSPVEGKVTQISKRRGEWLQPGDVLLTIMQMDVLRVEGRMKMGDAMPSDVERKPVQVVVETNQGSVMADGVIVFANPQVSGKDREFRVIAEFRNSKDAVGVWQVNPGMRATLRIDLNAAPIPLQQPQAPQNPQAPPFAPPAAPPVFPPAGPGMQPGADPGVGPGIQPPAVPGVQPPIDSMPPAGPFGVEQ